jgi:hypothetical protein
MQEVLIQRLSHLRKHFWPPIRETLDPESSTIPRFFAGESWQLSAGEFVTVKVTVKNCLNWRLAGERSSVHLAIPKKKGRLPAGNRLSVSTPIRPWISIFR